ncbi:MAG: phosphoenolpyruvate-utilizing N-terminal domain-containing protein, partial [Mesorhizobium sp.]|nr:phosphoenolpyruvate-utilizing N-terminal domain-containing protein [Mesorhizobium sp.]
MRNRHEPLDADWDEARDADDDPAQGRIFTGIAASPGYAEGPLHRIDAQAGSYARKESADAEAKALADAIAAAIARVAGLIEASSGDSAEILEFQLAMLEDDALSGPALAEVAAGATAWDAWSAVLDRETAGYEA